jgi:hypothetical protein
MTATALDALAMVSKHFGSTGTMSPDDAEQMLWLHIHEETAYHEAGHAIMAAFWSIPFHSVALELDFEAGTAGSLRSVAPGKPWNPKPMDHQRTWKQAVVAAAGRAATNLRNERHPKDKLMHFSDADKSDLAEILDYADQFKMPDPDRWRVFVSNSARDILARPDVWSAVEVLAGELMQNGEKAISSRRVRKILREARAEEVIA